MITSASNAKVRHVRKLLQSARLRREEGLFVVEGRKMFLEAPDSWIGQVFAAESFLKSVQDADREAARKAERFSMEAVSDSLFIQMSGTVTPQGIMAILRAPVYTPGEVIRPDGLYVVLEDLQDPGNLGTIFRTAEAAGAMGLLLTRTGVDPLSPKVVRATMGSVFRLPYLVVEDVREGARALKEKGIRLFAADLDGKNAYDEESYLSGSAFLVGNEGNGLTAGAKAAAQERIRIPMLGKAESLNAAMAAGILLFEASRQRRQGVGRK